MTLSSEKFRKDLAAAFSGYERHFDYSLVGLRLRQALDDYDRVDPKMAKVIKITLMSNFQRLLLNRDPWWNPKCKTAQMSTEEKAEMLINQLFRTNTGLFLEISRAINGAASEIENSRTPSPEGLIPCLRALLKFPTFEEETGDFVDACLWSMSHKLPLLCQQLKETKYLPHVDSAVVADYLEGLETKPLPDDLADQLPMLVEIPEIWTMFEKKAGNLPIYAAYTPAVKEEDIPYDFNAVVEKYELYYSGQNNFMALSYFYLELTDPLDADWVEIQFRSKSDVPEMRAVYTLLEHARRTLIGRSVGMATRDPDWKKFHQDALLPALTADTAAIEKRFRHFREYPPYVAGPVLPQPGRSWRHVIDRVAATAPAP